MLRKIKLYRKLKGGWWYLMQMPITNKKVWFKNSELTGKMYEQMQVLKSEYHGN